MDGELWDVTDAAGRPVGALDEVQRRCASGAMAGPWVDRLEALWPALIEVVARA